MAVDPARLDELGLQEAETEQPRGEANGGGDLRSQANAMTLIERFSPDAKLRANGDGRLHGRCPFPAHDDRHPSFGLFQDGGYVCSCGTGDVVRLFVELRGEAWIDSELPRYEEELREVLGVPSSKATSPTDRKRRSNQAASSKKSARRRQGGKPAAKPSGPPTKPSGPKAVPLPSPEHGFIREYVAAHEPATEAPAAYHHALSFVLLSMAIGRQAWLNVGGRVGLNLYVLLLGASTQERKSTARRFAHSTWRLAAERHPELFSEKVFLPTGSTSAEGLLDALAQDDIDRAVLSYDEFGLLIGRRVPSYVERVKELLTELYGGWTPGRLIRGATSIKPEPAFVCAIGTTTRSRFEDEITASDVTSGFLGRWLLIFPPSSEKVLAFPPEPQAKLVDAAIASLAEVAEKVRGEITYSEGAKAVISRWYEYHRRELREDRDGELAAPIFLRMDGTARKLAALLEAADNPRPNPVVSERSAQLAVEYADYVLALIRGRLLDGVLGEMAQKLRRLREVVEADPGIRRSDCMKRARVRDQREFEGLTRLLAEEGEIRLERGLGRNKSGIAYWPGDPA